MVTGFWSLGLAGFGQQCTNIFSNMQVVLNVQGINVQHGMGPNCIEFSAFMCRWYIVYRDSSHAALSSLHQLSTYINSNVNFNCGHYKKSKKGTRGQ